MPLKVRQFIPAYWYIFIILSSIPQTLISQKVSTSTIIEILNKTEHSIGSGNYKEAIIYGAEALSIFQSSENKLDTLIAKAHHLVGNALWYIGDLDQAEQHHRNALEIRLAVLGLNHPDVAASYNAFGNIHQKRGEYDAALTYYVKELKIKLESYGKVHPEIALTYNNFGVTYSYKGDYQKAVEFHQKAYKIWLASVGNEHPDIAKSHNNLGEVFALIGDYEKAIEHLQKSIEIWHAALGSDHPDVVNALINTGVVHSFKGDYKKELEYYNKALDILLKTFGENHSQVAIIYDNLGATYFTNGDYGKALEYHQKALVIQSTVLGVEHPSVINTFINIGGVYGELGDYDKALEYNHKALDLLQKKVGVDHPAFARAYNNIGFNYQNKGEPNKALKYHSKALEEKKRRFGDHHTSVATSYSNLGSTFKETGNYEKALDYHSKALKIRTELLGKSHSKVATSFNFIGSIYEEIKDYKKAIEFYEQSLTVRRNVFEDYHPEVANSYNNIAHIYLLQKDYKTALSYGAKAIKVLDKMRSRFSSKRTKQVHLSENFEIFENAIWTSMEVANSNTNSDELNEAFIYNEKAKSNLLIEAIRTSQATKFSGIPDSMLRKEYDLGIDIAHYEKKKFGEQQKGKSKNDSLLRTYDSKLFDFKREYDDLINLFEKSYPNYFKLKYNTDVVSVKEVQEMLQSGQAVVEYFTGENAIYVFVITSNDFQVIPIAKDFSLEDLVTKLRQGIYTYHLSRLRSDQLFNDYADSLTLASHQIYQYIFAPILEKVSLPEQLIIVPDGVLGYVPFELLIKELPEKNSLFGTHEYLLKDHLISYSYSATLLKEMRQRQHSKTKYGFLAFAPHFKNEELHADKAKNINQMRNGLGRLEHNIPEVENLQATMGGHVFIGVDATIDNFCKVAPDYKIVHLATHGKANDKSGDFAYLAFSVKGDSIENGLFYNRDLYNLQLNSEMVVLSACETGIGELQRGEGIISLARGFSYAGAKSIVTSMWGINDKKTKELMESFYVYIKAGLTKDAALRLAKLDFIDKYSHDAHPFYWAGFVPIGDMGAIDFTVKSHFVWMYILGVFFLIFLFYFFSRR